MLTRAEQRAPVLVKGPIRLGPGRRMTVYMIAAGVWTSGVLWLLFHYFLRRQSEFGFEAHPLEPWWLKLHGAFAFAALWLTGLLSANHIVNGWVSRRRRSSGLILLGIATIITITGYLLYYGGDDEMRNYTSISHWALGLAAPVAFIWHRVRILNRAKP